MRNQMKMIRHHHEATGKPTVTRRAVEEKRGKTLKRGLISEDATPALHTQRQQIREVAVAVRPHAMKPTEPARGRIIGFGPPG